MRHVNRHQARRFRAKSAGTQRYALVTILQGKTNFINREIAFWTYQTVISAASLPSVSADNDEISWKKSFFSTSS